MFLSDLKDHYIYDLDTICLGKGSFGEVVPGIELNTGNSVAIKISTNFGSFLRELVIYSSVDHPHVAKLIAWSYSEEFWYLVLPLGINIREALANKLVTLTETISGLTSAVGYLHSEGIFHGDLKEANILFLDGKVTLIDFGSSRFGTWISDKYRVQGINSTVGYTDPEYTPGDWNPIVSELYALAVIIFDLRQLEKGKNVNVGFGRAYGIVTSDSKLNLLLRRLASFPVENRSDLEVTLSGKVKKLEIPSGNCPNSFLGSVGNRSNPPIPSQQVFLGWNLFRYVWSKTSEPLDPNKLGLTCVYLSLLITGQDPKSENSSRWKKFQPNFDLIKSILRLTEGLLISETDWDRANCFEDLVSGVTSNFRSEKTDRTKHVYFYKVYEASLASEVEFNLNKSDLTSSGCSLADFTFLIPKYLTILGKTYNMTKYEHDISVFFFLHHRKLLPELDIRTAQTIYNRLAQHPLGVQILPLIVPYPVTIFRNFHVHPFQLTQDDYEMYNNNF